MGDSGLTKPTNQIVVAGDPRAEIYKVETATNMYAGRLVIKGTNDDDVIVGTAGGTVVGWLGYEHTARKHRPATVDTIYLQNAQAAVLRGPGTVLVASIPAGQNIAKGDRLVAAADGQLTKASGAIAPAGATAVTAHTAAPTITGPVPTEGIVVAVAEESLNSGGSPADIMVRSLI